MRILLTFLGLMLSWILLILVIFIIVSFNPSSNTEVNLTGPAILSGGFFIFWLLWVWNYKKDDKPKSTSNPPENPKQ
ncbi:MAG: hypothetical protein NZ516_05825 [Raineya sp.]|nr:hypothetical protein [Raineya sp.]